MNELEKLLRKIGIKVSIKEVQCIPVGSSYWRVTFARKVGKGEERKEIKLTLPFTLKPTTYTIIQSLNREILSGEKSFWDYSLFLGKPLDEEGEKEEVEQLHKQCKSISKRVKRFFSDQWENVAEFSQNVENGPTTATTTPQSNRPPAKKSA
jgi:hypothetical protein